MAKKQAVKNKQQIENPSRIRYNISGIHYAILFLFLISGMCGLVYQVVWVRILNLIFGVTAFAVSTVVTAFMAGLAWGSFYWGRKIEKSKNPLRIYGFLEIGVGIYALISPFIFSGIDSVYIFIFRTFSPGFYVFALIRFLLAVVIIILPTMFMGGTLPILVKYFVRQNNLVGRLAGYLYSFNTVGAVIGTIAAGFFMVKYMGVQNTITLTAFVNIIVGVAAFLISRKKSKDIQDEPQTEIPLKEPEKIPEQRLLLWGFALSGLASLAYEVLWTRSLLFFLGLTTYTFSTILAAFLVGIALGSYIFSRLVHQKRNLILWFGIVQLIIGLFALAVMPLIENFYSISNELRSSLGYYSWWTNVGIKFLLSFLLMLIPTIFMGGTFPIIVQAYGKTISGLGKKVGEVYSANTVGSIIGSFLAGFVLVPFCGVRLSIALVVLLNFAIGLFFIYYNQRAVTKRRYIIFGLAGILVVLVILSMNQKPLILASVEFKGPSRRYDLLHYKEGIDGSLAVLQDRVNGERELNINGESTAFTIYQDMQVHKLLGHLPMLVHPAPKDVLVVGFGLGSTSWATVQYPDVRTDCVELVRDEIETAIYFEPENHNVMDNPKFNLVITDGRDFVKGTRKKYDVISFNAIHPKISPNLYTLDFYEMCRDILKDQGIIIAWLPPNAITETEYQSLIKTFIQVFPSSSLWYVNPSHMLLMSSPDGFKIDYQQLKNRLALQGVNKDLKEGNLENIFELSSCFLMAEDQLAQYCYNAPINSDDLPYIEFSRELTVTVNMDVLSSLGRLKKSLYPYFTNMGEDSLEIKEKLKVYDQVKSLVAKGQVSAWNGQFDKAGVYYQEALSLDTDNANALYLNGLLARRKDDLIKLTELNPQNAKAFQALGEIYLQENNIKQAFQAFNRANYIDPEYAQPYHHLGVIYYLQQRPDKALVQLEHALKLDPNYGASYYYLGMCYWRMGKLDPAIENFEKTIELDPSVAAAHYRLGLGYEMKRWYDKALICFENALKVDPNYEPALIKLNDQSGNK